MEASLNDLLRKRIKDSGMTVNFIAVRAGIPVPVLWRFANGQQGLNLDTATKLAKFFGLELVDAEELAQLRSLRLMDEKSRCAGRATEGDGSQYQQAIEHIAETLDLDFVPANDKEMQAALCEHVYAVFKELKRLELQKGNSEGARHYQRFLDDKGIEKRIGSVRRYLAEVRKQAKAQGRGRESLTRKALTTN